MTTIGSVLDFWFADGMRARWFKKDADFDERVRKQLLPAHEAAVSGQFDAWKESARGCVALCILLDQVPRNVFRDSPRAFASDARALAVTHHALTKGFERDLNQFERLFLYLPLEHSETLADQDLCCRLTAELDADPGWLDFARRHREIVARFGRFPHRNAALARGSTAEEEEFLREPNSGF